MPDAGKHCLRERPHRRIATVASSFPPSCGGEEEAIIAFGGACGRVSPVAFNYLDTDDGYIVLRLERSGCLIDVAVDFANDIREG